MIEPTNRAAETPPRVNPNVNVSIVLARRTRETLLLVDGEFLRDVESFTLRGTMDHADAPALLTIVRKAPRREIGPAGNPTADARTVDASRTGAGNIAGVVELLTEHAVPAAASGDPLTTFMIRLGTDEDPRATTLRDILTDAERFRALRAYVEGPVESIELFPRDEQALDGKELDALADVLRTELTQARDGEPRRPT